MADIDLRHLEYFVAAAECGSFIKAARLVNVSQPAITKSIQRMEQWFGHLLFERGVELKLTEFGAALIGDAKKVLDDFDGLRQAANAFDKKWAVTLKIGAGPLIAETLAGPAVGRLLGRHPELKVVVHVDNYAAFPKMLRERRIHMFIADITELSQADDLTIQKLTPSRLQWFCRKGHPLAGRKAVTFPEVLGYPVVMPQLPLWAREWFTTRLSEGATPGVVRPAFQPSVICSQFSTLKRIVLASDSVSALTELALYQEQQANDLAVIDYNGAMPASNPGIVTLRKRQLPPAVHELAKEIDLASKQQ